MNSRHNQPHPESPSPARERSALSTTDPPSAAHQSNKLYRYALASLLLQTIFVVVRGHPGPNARIYEFFARASDSGVDVFNPQALAHWAIPWTYLDFTPFNLLVYKAIFGVKGVPGEMLFRLYQCAWLFLALLCIRRLAARAFITRPQELSLVALTAFNPLLCLLSIYSADDKISYFTLPLLIVTLSTHPRAQAFFAGLWSAWSGVGILFLPALAIRCWRHRSQRYLLLLLLALGLALAVLPFFPESRVLLSNRGEREAAAPFWFSIWRLIGKLYFPGLNRFALGFYALAIAAMYALRRLHFAPALVALCLSYCLLSNNTVPLRILSTLFLAVLFARTRRACCLYTAALLLFECLIGLAKSSRLFAHGLLNPEAPSTAVLVANVLLVNLLSVVAIAITLRSSTGSPAPVSDSRPETPPRPAESLPHPVEVPS